MAQMNVPAQSWSWPGVSSASAVYSTHSLLCRSALCGGASKSGHNHMGCGQVPLPFARFLTPPHGQELRSALDEGG